MLTELVRDFLDPAVFYQQLKNKGIDFYCGVPDSLLKGKMQKEIILDLVSTTYFYMENCRKNI